MGGGGWVRQILVVCQFAVLITLMLATVVVYSQVRYAQAQGLRLQEDQAMVIVVWAASGGGPVLFT